MEPEAIPLPEPYARMPQYVADPANPYCANAVILNSVDVYTADQVRAAILADREARLVWCGCGDAITAAGGGVCGTCAMIRELPAMKSEAIPLPEPSAWRWKVGDDFVYREVPPMHVPPGLQTLFTADQVRAAVLAERERCARGCEEQAEALAENLYGHPREKAIEWAKLDKFESAYQTAEELLELVAAAIRSGTAPAQED